MEAYFRKTKENKYQLLFLFDGKVCDGGKFETLKDCKRQAKNLGATDVAKWEHPKGK